MGSVLHEERDCQVVICEAIESMFNFFEQPWTLLGASVLVLFVVWTYRSVWDEKRRWWQLLIPIIVAATAVGLDFFVVTDLEKIHIVAKSLLKAAENEDSDAIARLIASDYKDSRHTNKAALVRRCRQEFNGPTIQVLKKKGHKVELSEARATMTASLFARLEKDSRWARQYKEVALVRIRLDLARQPEGRWLISRAEVLQVDGFPVSWGAI